MFKQLTQATYNRKRQKINSYFKSKKFIKASCNIN